MTKDNSDSQKKKKNVGQPVSSVDVLLETFSLEAVIVVIPNYVAVQKTRGLYSVHTAFAKMSNAGQGNK